MEADGSVILLVEDQALVASLQRQELEATGYRVIIAETGEEALALLSHAAPPVDAVVMDVELGYGRRDGVEIAEEILRDRDIPIIFSTAHTERETIERMDRVSPYGYVIKKSGMAALEASVKMALRLHDAQRLLVSQMREAQDLYSHAPCGYHSTAQDGTVLKINDTELRWLGYGREEVVGRLHCQDFLEPDCRDGFDLGMGASPGGEEEANWEVRLRRKDGSSFPALISRNWIRDPEGRALTSRATVVDISRQKEAEERIGHLLRDKELLLREVHHRIKNNMNTVISLLSMKASSCEDPRARSILTEATSQVESMGLLYDRLYRSQEAAELRLLDYLPSLVSEILAIFGEEKRIAFSFEIADLRLDAPRLSILGIILNELVTNSVKHAFTAIDEPRISLTLSSAEGGLHLVYADNGRGLPEDPEKLGIEGFGLKLLAGLAAQIEGEFKSLPERRGARFALDFPLEPSLP